MALPGKPGPKLTALYGSLTDERKATLVRVLTNPSITAEAISDALETDGQPISASTIRTYRRALKRKGLMSD